LKMERGIDKSIKERAVMVVITSNEQLIQERIRDLRENTDFVSTLLDNLVGYAIIAADFDGNIISYNEGARQIYGYTPEEIIGARNLEIFFPSEFIESGKFQQIADELIENGRFSCAGEKIRKSGESFPAQMVFTLTRDKSGKVVGLIEITVDLTEQKRAENAILERAKEWQTTFDSMHDLVSIHDRNYKLVRVNRAFANAFKMEPEELVGKTCYEVFHKTNKPISVCPHFRAMEIGKMVATEYFEPQLGIHVEETASPVFSGKGSLIGSVHIVTDITDRTFAAKRLRDAMLNFSEVVNNSTSGFIVTSRKGIVFYANPAAEILFGKQIGELIGTDFGFPVVPNEKTEIDIFHKAGKVVVAEMRVVETVWYEESAYLVSLNDVTERTQTRNIQESYNLKLKAQVSELEAFSYGIAHDLRSPLISIEGFNRLLREDVLNHDAEKVLEDMRLIESGVKKMQGFLNSTLEYSRSGQMLKRTEGVSFGAIVNEVIAGVKEQISSIGATVSVANKFPRIYADATRIAQVLNNLIQNSIKYRDKTVPLTIKISHRLLKGQTVFYVQDNGPGIDPDEAEKIFDLFYRGTSAVEGSGIGLAVVKKIIEAHGGRIWVQQGRSERGATMCFTLAPKSDTNKGDINGKD
jgi:PAS domain S-box-containing protein